MNTASSQCPACSCDSFDQLIDLGRVPHSGQFLTRPDDTFGAIELAFDYCPCCALLRQRSRDDDSHDYTHVSRGTSRQLPAYSFHLADSLRRHGVAAGDLIIEVGANDGAFLDILTNIGFRNLVGIEPSRACAAASIEKGHKIEITHLTEPVATALRARHGGARAVICRHTLEHVPDPLGLLAAMKTLLAAGGLLFVEIPNAYAIFRDMRCHELWDEHLHIMTPGNLSLMVLRAGFNVINTIVWPHLSSTNILLWAHLNPATPSAPVSPETSSKDVLLCSDFEGRWNTLSNRVAAELAECQQPIAAIGASHPQSNYLLYTKLGDRIAFLVDDDPSKVGRYSPVPQPAPIISTAQFSAGPPPGTVLRTAFGYDDWMDRLLAPLVNGNVRIVNPYSPAFLVSL
jgi:SAM-dependent methyltransferase